MKLLLSFVDTVSYLEFGDTPQNFRSWLDTYADLVDVGVSAEELWELRNSLLHMTSLDSRKVVAGTVRRLMFYVGLPPDDFPSADSEAKYVGVFQLIQCITSGLARYCSSFNGDRRKFQTFVERYDRLISDVRYFEVSLERMS